MPDLTTYVLAAMVAPLITVVVVLAHRVRDLNGRLDNARADYNDAVDREEETHQFLAVVGRQFFGDQFFEDRS